MPTDVEQELLAMRQVADALETVKPENRLAVITAARLTLGLATVEYGYSLDGEEVYYVRVRSGEHGQ